jgi:putative DNA primase/helicase
MNSEMIAVIKEYTARGFVVHPLSGPDDEGNSPGKRPIMAEWQKLTQTPENIFKHDGNIGLVCGKASNVIIIDFDHALFLPWLGDLNVLNTLKSGRTTGRGHLYIKYTDELKNMKNKDLGLEILSDGSNAVLPPSKHKSGEFYKYMDPAAPIAAAPRALIDNINNVFKIHAELKQKLAKTRSCFKTVLSKDISVHGADGRQYMIAVCADLKRLGASDEHIKMFARLMYKEDYNEARTLREFGNIDPAKTWKCDTLKAKLPSFTDPAECARCEIRRENVTTRGPSVKNISSPADNYFEKGRFVVKTLGDEVLSKYNFISMSDNPDELYIYEGGVYVNNDGRAANVIRTYATEALDDRVTKQHIEAVIYYICTKSLTPRHRVNNHANKINLKNGLYNLENKQLEPHNSDYLSTQQIPINYDPAAECPAISKFMLEILPPEDIALMIQLFGYAMIPNRDIQKAFMLTGSGSNGKGTLIRLLSAFIGEGNSANIGLQTLSEDKFSVATLYGKLINICGDLPDKNIDDDTMFKALTGKDTIRGERKYEMGFDFKPVARLLFSANDLPRHPKGGYAWNRRWIIVNFLKKFENKTDDKNLDEKLQTPGELSGLLNVALRALDWLLETKEYYYFKTPEQVGEEYLLKSDPIETFLKECTTPADGYADKLGLYNFYCEWVKIRQINRVLTYNIFNRTMRNKRFIEERPYFEGEWKPRAFMGIELNLDVNLDSSKTRQKPGKNPAGCLSNANDDSENISVLPGLPGFRPFYNYLSIGDVVDECRNGKYKIGGIEQFVEKNPANPANPANTQNSSNPSLYTTIIKHPKEKPQNTSLTELLFKAKQQFEKEKGVVNSATITVFSIWTCTMFKPQWQQGKESGYYEPSAIKGIASKLFGLTPAPRNLAL